LYRRAIPKKRLFMDAIIMPSITSLINQIRKDHPTILFREADRFSWNPNQSTITYIPDSSLSYKLLHEAAHGILQHQQYTRDIELLGMERAAWEKATQLGLHYGVTIPNEEIEIALDTYRDWMHARSLCPNCHSTGIQHSHVIYRCIACHTQWRVNEARTCQLRRYAQ
jgi:hypothetical protein